MTISYGSWPNDVFLLFFGWVDDDNPHDAVCLFTDLFDLTTFHQRSVGGLGMGPGVEATVRALEEALGASNLDFQRCAIML